MAQPVFSTTQVHRGSFKAGDLKMFIKGNPLATHVVQQISVQYQQSLTTLFEIGSTNMYYVGGRAQGTSTFARVIGPGGDPGFFSREFGDICNSGIIDLLAEQAGCLIGQAATQKASVSYTMAGVVLMGLAISTQAQDVMINEQLNFQFIDLSY